MTVSIHDEQCDAVQVAVGGLETGGVVDLVGEPSDATRARYSNRIAQCTGSDATTLIVWHGRTARSGDEFKCLDCGWRSSDDGAS